MYLKEAVGGRVCVWKEAFELGGKFLIFPPKFSVLQ